MTVQKIFGALHGQSDCLGQEQARPDSPETTPVPGVAWWDWYYGTDANPLAWVSSPLDYYDPARHVGMECTLGAMLQPLGRCDALVKFARGSIGIAQHWRPTDPTGYMSAMFAFIRKMQSRLALENPGTEWVLGWVAAIEHPQDMLDAGNVAAEPTNLRALIARWRDEFHPDLPFILHRPKEEWATYSIRNPAYVHEFQDNLADLAAADPLVFVQNTDGKSLMADHTHFDRNGQPQVATDTATLVAAAPLPIYDEAHGVVRVSHYATLAIAQDVARFLGSGVRAAPVDSAARWAVPDVNGKHWINHSAWS